MNIDNWSFEELKDVVEEYKRNVGEVIIPDQNRFSVAEPSNPY